MSRLWRPNRRTLLRGAAATLAARAAQAAALPAHEQPQITGGVMTGDVSADSAFLWSRSDRPALMRVRWKARAGPDRGELRGPVASHATDLTAQVGLTGLPPDADIVYEIRFEDVHNGKLSEPATGTFRTAPVSRRTVRMHWGGDLCGQGWGIDPARGGYRIFDTMRARDPDFLLFSGDRIYADGPLKPEITLPDGTTWRNLITEAKTHVAETLDDFRGNYRYHLQDRAWRDFMAAVPMVAQWDDHEVVDNWSPEGWVLDDRYTLHDMHTLALRARRAMAEYTPMASQPFDWARVYRKIAYGPLLDVFVLDMRSYRFANGDNMEAHRRASATMLGSAQLSWLERQLNKSTALWKVIACPQPLSTVIYDDFAKRSGHDGLANTGGPPLGREHELAHLLRFCHRKGLRNVVFLAADVHYAAAHHYHPDRAAFTGFSPFWEFVAGPFHAGTFGPNELDPTFGPEVVFQRAAPPGMAGLGPAGDHQFFGELQIDATGGLEVRLIDVNGAVMHATALRPEPR